MTAFPANIIVVDDDPLMRTMLMKLLAIEGFHVVGAEDGLEALHVLRAVRHRAPEAPSLVLLDLKMPRLGGDEFRRAQLADPILASVPVVVMSGASDLAQRANGLGAVASIGKPVERDTLLAIVRQHCV